MNRKSRFLSWLLTLSQGLIFCLSAPVLLHGENLKDLQNRIADSESRFQGQLKEGVDKHFTWSNSENPQKTEFAIVYLHGFISSRADADTLLADWSSELGANTFSTRFTGHGFKSSEEIKHVTVDDWVGDAQEALKIGNSRGCTF